MGGLFARLRRSKIDSIRTFYFIKDLSFFIKESLRKKLRQKDIKDIKRKKLKKKLRSIIILIVSGIFF